MKQIRTNLEQINARIEKAAHHAKRDPSEITLLLATKTRSIEEINYAITLGYGLIGENRAQELSAKAPHLLNTETSITPRENHFIGTLQGNKVNEVVAHAHCIQSVDRLRIARRIHNYCQKNHLKRSILVQVNTSNEASKHGVAPNELYAFLESLNSFNSFTIDGLMTIGLNSKDETKVRNGFATLRKLKEGAQQRGLLGKEANHLSMGMSNDLELAIIEGATIIRVGSAIFGARTYQ